MLRWAIYILLAPFVLILGAAQSFQLHPVDSGSISVRVDLPPSAQAPVAGPIVPVPTVAPALRTSPGDETRLGQLVAAAQSWLGVPYLWGGCSPRGIDCSCFVQHAYAAIGISVPRTTVTQVAAFIPVPREQLRVGDSLFFNNTCTNCGPNPTHVGMYLGNGLMIDAGDPVKIEPVYWNKFAEAGRPPGL